MPGRGFMGSLLRGEELDFLVGFVLVSPHMHVVVVVLLWILSLFNRMRVIEIKSSGFLCWVMGIYRGIAVVMFV